MYCFFFNCTMKRNGSLNTAYKFVDSFPIKDITNLYVYHRTTTFHEGNESYLALAENYCEVFSNEKATFAKTGYLHIDTVIQDTVYVTSSEIEFLDTNTILKFKIIPVKPMDSIKLRLDTLIIDCK